MDTQLAAWNVFPLILLFFFFILNLFFSFFVVDIRAGLFAIQECL